MRYLLALLLTLTAACGQLAPSTSPAVVGDAVYVYPSGTSLVFTMSDCRGGEVIYVPAIDRLQCEGR